MSVHHQHFILYGYRFDYDILVFLREDADTHETELETEYDYRNATPGDIAVIPDGKNGDYCYIGVLQYKTKSSRDARPTITPQKLTTPDSLPMLRLGRVIGAYGLEPDGDPAHHVFTHVT